MPNFSLLFARSPAEAEASACDEWKWDKVGDLGHDEYRRPDTGERVRFVPDRNGETLQGLRWNTRVYLADAWRHRSDASQIMGMLDSGFFKEADPVLPPPRSKRDKASDALGEIRRNLARLEKRP